LIQTKIEFPNEIGLFYYRVPGSENGIITGITIKKFLEIEGNNQDTIEQLLKKTPRFALQIKKLHKKFDLGEVLSKGERKYLVPFGNHNRGTEFLDGKHLITDELHDTFNKILKPITGLYYGRLDIRYEKFEELEKGINFSIIEFNGAKSEPTHIYDSSHSFGLHKKKFLDIKKNWEKW
jgi:DNA-binding transcriptional regulator WhiA